jgi:hypothetical protein
MYLHIKMPLDTCEFKQNVTQLIEGVTYSVVVVVETPCHKGVDALESTNVV